MIRIEKDVNDQRNRAERGGRNIQRVVTKGLSFFARLVFEQGLNVQTKDFGQKTHCCLCKDNRKQAQPKRGYEKGFAEIVCDASAEGVSQCGEEEMERACEAEHEN